MKFILNDLDYHKTTKYVFIISSLSTCSVKNDDF